MAQAIVQTAFFSVVPYLAPVIFLISAVVIAEKLIDLIHTSISPPTRRREY